MLCSIADVYDAMRSQRSYQQAFPTERILEVLKRNDGKQFDQHLVRRFVQLIGIYPVGTLVRLDTGEVGVVQRVYAPDPYRPHVRVLIGREGERLELPYDLNLWETADNPQLPKAIVAPLDPADYSFDPLDVDMRRTALVVLTLALAAPRRRAPAAIDPPKLAVIIVVDQMRADYVERFKGDWTGGLKRLVTEGAWFTRAAYPYLLTITCPGHATISTGTFPQHPRRVLESVVGSRVRTADAVLRRSVSDQFRLRRARQGSQQRLPAAGSDLRRSLARGAQCACGDALGQGAQRDHAGGPWRRRRDVVERSERHLAHVVGVRVRAGAGGRSASSPPIPSPRTSARAGRRRCRSPAIATPDAASGERPPSGWTSTFPHVLNGTSGKAGRAVPSTVGYAARSPTPISRRWRRRSSTSSDLGAHDGVDLLGVSFTGLDRVGHKFGPRSQEVREHLARLDATTRRALRASRSRRRS